MTPSDTAPDLSDRRSVGSRIGFSVLGIVFILCGLFALLVPVVSTLAATLVFAAVLGAAGLAQVVHAFRAPAWKGFFLHLALGVIYLIGCAVFVFRPISGALLITIWLAWVVLFTGAGEVALAFRIRPQKGWGWLLFSGLVALFCGMWLLLRIPISGFFVPGILLGITLLMEGFAFIALALG